MIQLPQMNYFTQEQFIAQVDKEDTITGSIDKWKAHKEGILHRAFTVAIFVGNKVLIQHRKHPVFDQVLDVTISSHQIFKNEILEEDIPAILNTLKREWFITESDLVNDPTYKGNIYYKAKDPLSEYTEHEICHIYTCEIKEVKLPNFEFAYGFSMQTTEELKNRNNSFHSLLAPWVLEAFKQGVL